MRLVDKCLQHRSIGKLLVGIPEINPLQDHLKLIDCDLLPFLLGLRPGKRCRSSLFCHRQKPVRSQYSAFNNLRVLLQNRNRLPENGSCDISPWVIAAKPLICFLKSVAPGRTKIRTADQSRNILQLLHRLKYRAKMFGAHPLRYADLNTTIDEDLHDAA